MTVWIYRCLCMAFVYLCTFDVAVLDVSWCSLNLNSNCTWGKIAFLAKPVNEKCNLDLQSLNDLSHNRNGEISYQLLIAHSQYLAQYSSLHETRRQTQMSSSYRFRKSWSTWIVEFRSCSATIYLVLGKKKRSISLTQSCLLWLESWRRKKGLVFLCMDFFAIIHWSLI